MTSKHFGEGVRLSRLCSHYRTNVGMQHVSTFHANVFHDVPFVNGVALALIG